MRRYNLLESLNSPELLELKLSPTLVSVGGVLAVSTVSTVRAMHLDGDDPLPEPEPAPPPYPGDNPPIEYPLLPPSGPAGPGS
jgi:hypothetical protein